MYNQLSDLPDFVLEKFNLSDDMTNTQFIIEVYEVNATMHPFITLAVHIGFEEFSKTSRAQRMNDKIDETSYIHNL